MYSDWDLDSELTELSTSSSEAEEDYKPVPKRAAGGKAATKEYKVCTIAFHISAPLSSINPKITVMRPPRTTSYSADWVFSAHILLVSSGLRSLTALKPKSKTASST